MLDDYIFFAQAWKWPPSEVDKLPWSYRKKLKQTYQDHILNNMGDKK